ncbi:DUF721 domain-containing protein [Patescibacteria group bacterium]|nr:DUF721 domain-containing protein [Patescibacteria group bacterium]
MAFQSIKRLIPGAIQAAGLETQITSVQVLQTTTDVLRRLWGEEKAALVEIRSYHEGALRLYTSTPAAAQECKIYEVRLMNEINRALGAKKIIKIQCFVN